MYPFVEPFFEYFSLFSSMLLDQDVSTILSWSFALESWFTLISILINFDSKTGSENFTKNQKARTYSSPVSLFPRSKRSLDIFAYISVIDILMDQ